MKAKKQSNEECVCISKTKYHLIRSAIKLGIEAMDFGGFCDKNKKALANIKAFAATL